MEILKQPKLKASSDKDWRDFYEAKCRELRKENIRLREACQAALEVLRGERYPAGVAVHLENALK